jgi:hypothetical protein
MSACAWGSCAVVASFETARSVGVELVNLMTDAMTAVAVRRPAVQPG